MQVCLRSVDGCLHTFNGYENVILHACERERKEGNLIPPVFSVPCRVICHMQAAYAAHRRFSSVSGDLPALLRVWEAWSQVSTVPSAIE